MNLEAAQSFVIADRGDFGVVEMNARDADRVAALHAQLAAR